MFFHCHIDTAHIDCATMNLTLNHFDNGGRRTGFDRRQFSYSTHVPERRSGLDRRSGVDRRQEPPKRNQVERRSIFRFAAITA
jgi:hypothetical protein